MYKLADISGFEAISNGSSCYVCNVAPFAAAATGAGASRYAKFAKFALPYAQKAFQAFSPQIGNFFNAGLRKIVSQCVKRGIPLDQILGSVQQMYREMALQQSSSQAQRANTPALAANRQPMLTYGGPGV